MKLSLIAFTALTAAGLGLGGLAAFAQSAPAQVRTAESPAAQTTLDELTLAQSTFAQSHEPACVVTYAVASSRAVSVRDAHCDTQSLEPAAVAFALSRIEGDFGAALIAQAPIEIEFTFSEAAIRRHQTQSRNT